MLRGGGEEEGRWCHSEGVWWRTEARMVEGAAICSKQLALPEVTLASISQPRAAYFIDHRPRVAGFSFINNNLDVMTYGGHHQNSHSFYLLPVDAVRKSQFCPTQVISSHST
jgi:hypothetical protein